MSKFERFFSGNSRGDHSPLQDVDNVETLFKDCRLTDQSMAILNRSGLQEVRHEPSPDVSDVAPHHRGMPVAELRPLLVQTWQNLQVQERQRRGEPGYPQAVDAAAQGVIEMFPMLAEAEERSPDQSLFVSLASLLGDSDLDRTAQANIEVAFGTIFPKE